MTAYEKFQETFGPAAVTRVVFDWVPGLIAAVVTVLIFWGLQWFSSRVLDRLFVQTRLDPTASTFIRAVVRFTITIVGGLTALGQLGVDTTGVLTSLGVMGLTIGFAAQNTLSNVISGIFIFWDRPFVIGDLIDVDGEYGRVETITLRSTRLVTVDGRMLAIPNAKMANEKVASYTNFPHLRLAVEVTVNVNESIGRVREVLLGLCDGPAFMAEPAPQVVVKALNDYNTLFELRVWIHNERDHIAERFRLRERVKEALDAAGIDMPYETLRLAPIELVKEA
ncbi:MAG: mechanosensitive ion channel family protein [Myxococcota bacterium]